jgi:hypothetical protein
MFEVSLFAFWALISLNVCLTLLLPALREDYIASWTHLSKLYLLRDLANWCAILPFGLMLLAWDMDGRLGRWWLLLYIPAALHMAFQATARLVRLRKPGFPESPLYWLGRTCRWIRNGRRLRARS